MVGLADSPGLAYSVTDFYGLDELSVIYTVGEGTAEGGSAGIDGILFGAWSVIGDVVALLFGSWSSAGVEFEPDEEDWVG